MARTGPLRRFAAGAPTATTVIRAVVFMAVLYLLPYGLTSYWQFEFSQLFAYVIATLGLDIIFGRTGQLSLSHAAFVGLGAYTAGLFATHSINAGLALLAVIGISLVAGVVMGVPALRLSGFRLAVMTLAFGELFVWALQQTTNLTGGTQGLTVPSLTAGSFTTFNSRDSYYLAAVFVLVATAVVVRLRRSQFAVRMLIVRDSELAAAATGVHITRVKISAFMVGSVFAGISGWLMAYTTGFLSPSGFGLVPSAYYLVAVILGGSGSVLGSWLGAAYFVLVPTLFGAVGATNLFALVAGGVLVIVVLLAPGGLSKLVFDGWGKLRRRLGVGTQPSSVEGGEWA